MIQVRKHNGTKWEYHNISIIQYALLWLFSGDCEFYPQELPKF